jgi:hypothetical protein
MSLCEVFKRKGGKKQENKKTQSRYLEKARHTP